MRSLLCLLIGLSSLTSIAVGAEPAVSPTTVASSAGVPSLPQLRGILAVGKERQFSLVSSSAGAATWVKLGATFEGWTLTDYKAADETLILARDGQHVPIRLAGSSIADAPAAAAVKGTIADAEELLRKMDFDRMLSRILDQQKAGMANMTRQMTGGKDLPPEAKAMQKQATDLMFEAMKVETIKEDVAKIYSELFSKDEMRAMMDFYGTPAGQAMIEKQPEISQRMNQLMMARIATVMPKIRELQQESINQMKAKAAAGAK
ncbi:MAG: DUF2059 domain-containing protein [Opitutaceae bacterium]|nr:DUF2059 domain-containing protein [Opitutaceae bacterium]